MVGGGDRRCVWRMGHARGSHPLPRRARAPCLPRAQGPALNTAARAWAWARGKLRGHSRRVHAPALSSFPWPQVRSVAGDLVEEVKLLDTFTHPKTVRGGSAGVLQGPVPCNGSCLHAGGAGRGKKRGKSSRGLLISACHNPSTSGPDEPVLSHRVPLHGAEPDGRGDQRDAVDRAQVRRRFVPGRGAGVGGERACVAAGPCAWLRPAALERACPAVDVVVTDRRTTRRSTIERELGVELR